MLGMGSTRTSGVGSTSWYKPYRSSANSLRLRQAIVSNDISLVERLLSAGARLLQNTDFEDKSNTSLHLAAQHGHAELVELLISHGHDSAPEVTDLIYSNSTNNLGASVNTDGHTPLHLAAAKHHNDVVELLCLEFPSTINRGDNFGCTPLHLAAQSSNNIRIGQGKKGNSQPQEDVEAIQTLIRHGANIYAQDHEGNTCLHKACAWGNLKTARVLVHAGADPLKANHKGFKPESYSLTVAADVYFRNLVSEYNQRQVDDQFKARERRVGGGGNVRLVQEESEEDYYDPEEEQRADADEDNRARADSGRSYMTVSSGDASFSGLGISASTHQGTRAETAWYNPAMS